MKHKHHKIPRYRGGGDEPENLIEVSITQHIMWHFANYKLWDDYRDKIAYKLLANTDASEEIELARLQASREAIKNRSAEDENQRGINISIAKKRRAHITAEQTRKRWERGNWYTEDGIRRLKESNKKIKSKYGVKIKCVETGRIYNSIREAADKMNFRRRSITESLQQGIQRGGFTFIRI